MKKKVILDTLILLSLGALSSLSLPPINLFLINFFSFSFFFIFLHNKLNNKLSKKTFFYYGWLFGYGYFLTSLYWITISLTFDKNLQYLIPISLIIIPAFLALFYGLITYFFSLFKIKSLISSFFLFSLLFGLVEFLRGNILTGFPWNLTIYSMSNSVNFLSFISVIGTYSFNLIIISFFTFPAVYILRKSKKEIFLCIVFLLLPIIFFSYSLFYKQEFLSNKLVKNSHIIRIISSDISLDRFYNNDEPENVIKELIELSSPEKDKKIFFIWPEGIIPNIYQDEIISYINLFNDKFDKDHLIGIGVNSRILNSNKDMYFNSLSIFDHNLNLIENYNKVNLVPFGEFLPFEAFLNKLGLNTITNNFGSFTKGNDRKVISLNSENELQTLKFLPLICYEIIYTGNLTKNLDYNFILNISEDGWFGKSIGPKQHFAHSLFRAIETGKYVVRSANNGMTAIINPLGEIEKKLDYEEVGFIDFHERRDIEPTIFSKYGNKIFLVLILLYIFLIFSFNRINNG